MFSSFKIDLFIMAAIGKTKEGENLKARLVRHPIRKDERRRIRIARPESPSLWNLASLAVIMNNLLPFRVFNFLPAMSDSKENNLKLRNTLNWLSAWTDTIR